MGDVLLMYKDKKGIHDNIVCQRQILEATLNTQQEETDQLQSSKSMAKN